MIDNILNRLEKNKDIIIKLKLDKDGNLIYFHLEDNEQQNNKEIKKETTMEDRVAEFDKEVNEKISSGKFTDYEIECFIERWHPIHGTWIPMHHG